MQPPTRKGRVSAVSDRVPVMQKDWAFFLDVDGTLLDLADHPDAVVVEPDLVEALGRLKRTTGGAVALISGRRIADLDRLFAPLRVAVAGQHGLERRDAAGTVHHHARHDAGFERCRRELQGLVESHSGLLLEDKGVTLALHYRRAPQLETLVDRRISELVAGLDGDYRLQHGKMVLEIKPGGHDKGTAIEAFMREPPFSGKVPVFIGDDVTDEDGFRIVNALGGHSIKVGDGASAAQWRVATAQAVRVWLGDYLQRFEAPAEAS